MIRNVWKPFEVLDLKTDPYASEAIGAIAHYLVLQQPTYRKVATGWLVRLHSSLGENEPPTRAEIDNAVEVLADRAEAQWANLLAALKKNSTAGVTYTALKLLSPFENLSDETVLAVAAQAG